MSFWGLVTKVSERMEEEKTADGRNIKNNQEENKMKYENGNACGCEPADMMPVEDLSNMLHETRAMAQEAGRLAGRIGNHLFGSKDGVACCGEEKRNEPINFKDELADTRRTLKETIDDLAKLCTLVGV